MIFILFFILFFNKACNSIPLSSHGAVLSTAVMLILAVWFDEMDTSWGPFHCLID